MHLALVLLLLCGTVLLWGTMYVAARKYETYDGIVFQWYMCCGVLLAGIFIHLLFAARSMEAPFAIYNEGLIGGGLWALANIFVVPSVKLLGLGVGFTLYHSVNLVMGYLNGKYGLYGLPVERTNWKMDVCTVFYFASFILMVSIEQKKTQMRSSAQYGSIEASEQLDQHRGKRFLSGGIACGLFAGYLTSVNMVPFSIWAKHRNVPVSHFTLSQCIGIFLASSLYTLVAAPSKRVVCKMWPERPMVWPPVLSGVAWTLGFVLATTGVSELGMTVGYVITAVGPVGMSALCSYFWFQEIAERDQFKFWIAIALQVVGVVASMIFSGRHKFAS